MLAAGPGGVKQLSQIRQIVYIIEFVKKHIIVSYNTKTMWKRARMSQAKEADRGGQGWAIMFNNVHFCH